MPYEICSGFHGAYPVKSGGRWCGVSGPCISFFALAYLPAAGAAFFVYRLAGEICCPAGKILTDIAICGDLLKIYIVVSSSS